MMTDRKKDSLVLNTVVAILLVVLIGFVVLVFVNGANKAAEQANVPHLNLKIDRDATGLSLSNKEQKSLTGCRVTINGKYLLRADRIDTFPTTYQYGDFTDSNGTRFNYSTTQPKTVYVSDCSEEPKRDAAYQW